MLSSILSFFGSTKVADSAAKIVDKLAGTDWTPKDKADFFLNYMEATKHQSPARRVIAIGLSAFWLLLGLLWVINTMLGHYLTLEAGTASALDIKLFMADNLKEPMNYVIMFYFGIAAVQAIRK